MCVWWRGGGGGGGGLMRYNSAFDSYLNHTNFSNRISMLLFFFSLKSHLNPTVFFSLLADRLCQRRYKCIMGAKLEELRVHGQIKKKEKKKKKKHFKHLRLLLRSTTAFTYCLCFVYLQCLFYILGCPRCAR